MQDIPAQLHSIRKTTVGDTIISFMVDEMYIETVQELFAKKIGTQFTMKLEDVTTGVFIGGNAQNDDTKQKFFNQLHAKMREFQEWKGCEEKEVKTLLIGALKTRGVQIESTKELDIKQLAVAIGIMNSLLG